MIIETAVTRSQLSAWPLFRVIGGAICRQIAVNFIHLKWGIQLSPIHCNGTASGSRLGASYILRYTSSDITHPKFWMPDNSKNEHPLHVFLLIHPNVMFVLIVIQTRYYRLGITDSVQGHQTAASWLLADFRPALCMSATNARCPRTVDHLLIHFYHHKIL